jgi:hypothetical protein
LKGAQAAEPLAKTEEAKQLLRAVGAPSQMVVAFAFPPGVPSDRVQALRSAFDRTMADAQFMDEVQRANITVIPTSGQDVEPIVEQLLNTPPATLEQLKDILSK